MWRHLVQQLSGAMAARLLRSADDATLEQSRECASVAPALEQLDSADVPVDGTGGPAQRQACGRRRGARRARPYLRNLELNAGRQRSACRAHLEANGTWRRV